MPPTLMAMSIPRVLSIQSHVVRGVVGNKSAVFPLQLLGLNVDAVNSVQFSNHTGYAGGFRGEVLQGDQLWALLEGLEANNLLRGYSHVLTGYIGSESMLLMVVRVLEKLREHNPSLTYVCDPVMGDNGNMYVPQELVKVYRETVVGFASVLTPNQFEAELLTGQAIHSREDAIKACDILHQNGPHTVILTSLDLEPRDSLSLIASTTLLQEEGSAQRFEVQVARKDGHFTGTGDLLAALILGWSVRHPKQLDVAVCMAVRAMQAVLSNTIDAGETELCLVQSQQQLQDPPQMSAAEFKLTPLS